MTTRVCSWVRVVCSVLAMAAGAVGVAQAQLANADVEQAELGRLPANQTAVELANVPTMRVSRTAEVQWLPAAGGFGVRGPCQTVGSHTNANFSGGSYTVQAGFAQGESAAVTYNVPANQFPLRIDLAEMIFATSAATVQTTTIWEVEFWAGLPGTGQLIVTVTADDVTLPYLRVGPGTAGVNVQFSVDPNDPDQIIIPSNASNSFSTVWRIVQHNNQTSNPCVTGPSTATNAFPTTDNPSGGLSQASLNWLFGLNCGPLGCPANGGWSRFVNLNQFCRPGGDWVTRTTYTSVNCAPATGACCLPSGSCSILLQNECATQGGTYRGDNTTCATANCPVPTGACCLSNGFCLNLSETDCAGIAGTFQGVGSACGAGNACPSGACCLPSGSCVITSPVACRNQQGTFRGVNTTCAGANCPQPNGACCFTTGSCLSLTSALCTGAGGNWQGALTTCGANTCAAACDDIDFNNNQVFPEDQDVIDFFNVLAGGNCPACNDIDFNNNLVFPEDQDVIDFFNVLAGGTCP